MLSIFGISARSIKLQSSSLRSLSWMQYPFQLPLSHKQILHPPNDNFPRLQTVKIPDFSQPDSHHLYHLPPSPPYSN